VSESQWCIPKEKERFYFFEAVKLLTSKSLRDYIEKTLDEDRRLGEWENIENRTN
jgi:hypothetical protein